MITRRTTKMELIKWFPSEVIVMALNIDEAVANNGSAGYGGLLRNTEGKWIAGFSKVLGTCQVLHVEQWDVGEGVNMTLDQRVQWLEIQKIVATLCSC